MRQRQRVALDVGGHAFAGVEGQRGYGAGAGGGEGVVAELVACKEADDEIAADGGVEDERAAKGNLRVGTERAVAAVVAFASEAPASAPGRGQCRVIGRVAGQAADERAPAVGRGQRDEASVATIFCQRGERRCGCSRCDKRGAEVPRWCRSTRVAGGLTTTNSPVLFEQSACATCSEPSRVGGPTEGRTEGAD